MIKKYRKSKNTSMKLSSNGLKTGKMCFCDDCYIKKKFSQKLKQQNFMVPCNLQRGCFQKNVKQFF